MEIMECLHEWIEELDDKDNLKREFCLYCDIDHNHYRKIRTMIMGEARIVLDQIGNKAMIERSFINDATKYGNRWNENKREEYKKIKELQRRMGING